MRRLIASSSTLVSFHFPSEHNVPSNSDDDDDDDERRISLSNITSFKINIRVIYFVNEFNNRGFVWVVITEADDDGKDLIKIRTCFKASHLYPNNNKY